MTFYDRNFENSNIFDVSTDSITNKKIVVFFLNKEKFVKFHLANQIYAFLVRIECTQTSTVFANALNMSF